VEQEPAVRFGRGFGEYGIDAYLETTQLNINLIEAPIGWY
jgi:hypothetical protein